MPEVRIVWRDEALVVVDKPGDLTVHPTANAYTRTLTAYLQTLDGGPFHPAHRLDRETSGLVICGKAGAVSGTLKAQFSERTTRKIYLALVRGPFDAAMEVGQPLDFDGDSPIHIKMGVRPGGAPSASSFSPVVSSERASLILCAPHTGRQHQLRAHLEWAGHPVVGDKIYGAPPEWFLSFIKTGWTPELAHHLIFERQMLHAAFLRLPHPVTGEPCEFFADVPPDFRAACGHLGLACPPAEALFNLCGKTKTVQT
jgi:23S rRNA pseudouridine1911/1915/1917 synthase